MKSSANMKRRVWRVENGLRPVSCLIVGFLAIAHPAKADTFAPNASWVESPLADVNVSTQRAALAGYGTGLAIFERTALIGSPYSNTTNSMGEVFVFQHLSSGWAEQMPILPPTGHDGFGWALAMSSDFFAIGSTGSDVAVPIWIVPRANPIAGYDAILPASADLSYLFGEVLALQGDTLLAGDPGGDGGNGQVLVYRFDGNTWGYRQRLSSVTGMPDLTDAGLGSSIALSGNIALVGAPYEENGGTVFAFARASEADDFAIVSAAMETPLGAATFGSSLALNSDATVLAVGDPNVNDQTGAVWLYQRDRVSGAWIVEAASSSSATLNGVLHQDLFGTSLVFAGTQLLVGAPAGASRSGPGVVHTYSNSTSGWTYEGPLSNAAGMGVVTAATVEGTAVATAGGNVYVYDLALGVSCQSSSDCGSGYCVDGVCCETACDGLCESCLATETNAAAGECRPIPSADDPKHECAASGDGCLPGGCNGAGACAVAPPDQICQSSSCASTRVAMTEAHCDGQGACTPSASVTCGAGFSCVDGACRAEPASTGKLVPLTADPSCSSSDDCEHDSYCLEGACVSGAQCAKEENAAYDADGAKTLCDPQTCVAKQCSTQCSTTRTDCVDGYVCDPSSHACVLETTFATAESSAEACTFAPPLHRAAHWPSWLPVAGFVRVLRRRTSKRTSARRAV